MSDYGLMPGRYPAIVRTYNQARRTCRIEIPGLTEGGDVLPEAELEYSIGDRSRSGQFETEYHIMPGDTVWIAFIGGDSRFPIITGFRNPEAGNSADWRRWHHENMEILATTLMNLIAGGDVLIKSATKVTIQAPAIILDAEQTTSTGKHTINGLLKYLAGLVGFGGAAGSTVTGDIVVDGIGVKAHHHTAQGAYADTTPSEP